MADQQVIREFLVQLGFKQDEKSLKKFTDGVTGATANVIKLGAAIQAVALTIGAGVAAFSSKLEAMYFASKKAGSAAINLKAIEQAVQDLTGAGDEAVNSVQSLARFMRETPGASGFLQSLGIQTEDANGKLLDTTQIMENLAPRLRQMPYFMAKQYADMLGITEDTLRAMLDPKFDEAMRAKKKALEKSGFDKAAEDGHKFMMMIRDMQLQLQIFAVQVQQALMEKLGGSMEGLANWIRTQGPIVAARVADILVMILTLAEKIFPAIVWLVDKFIALDTATDGWSTKVMALVVALNMLGATSLVGGVLSLAGAFAKLAGPILAISAAAAGGVYIGGKIKQMIDGMLSKATGSDTTLGSWLYDQMNPSSAKAGQAQGGQIKRPGSSGGALDPMRFFMGMGWTKEQAAGIVANLQHESNFKANAVGDGGKAYGIAQWHPDRQANFKKWAGKDIRESTAEEQMRFVDYELRQGSEQKAGSMLMAANNSRQAGEIVSRYYERPANREAEAARRGETAVTVAQTTNINVNGGGDPIVTAQLVTDEQRRVNSDMTRNLNTAIN